MKNYSATIAGLLAVALGAIAKQINRELPVSEQDIANTISTVIQILGLLLAYVSRVRQGDITWYGKRIS